jgi:hypothetical protein
MKHVKIENEEERREEEEEEEEEEKKRRKTERVNETHGFSSLPFKWSICP